MCLSWWLWQQCLGRSSWRLFKVLHLASTRLINITACRSCQLPGWFFWVYQVLLRSRHRLCLRFGVAGWLKFLPGTSVLGCPWVTTGMTTVWDNGLPSCCRSVSFSPALAIKTLFALRKNAPMALPKWTTTHSFLWDLTICHLDRLSNVTATTRHDAKLHEVCGW